MQTFLVAFDKLLSALLEKYGICGTIDIAMGTGMTHYGLTSVETSLRNHLNLGTGWMTRKTLLAALDSLLSQMLVNVQVSYDQRTQEFLKALRAELGPDYEPDECEAPAKLYGRFKKQDVLEIIHASIG